MTAAGRWCPLCLRPDTTAWWLDSWKSPTSLSWYCVALWERHILLERCFDCWNDSVFFAMILHMASGSCSTCHGTAQGGEAAGTPRREDQQEPCHWLGLAIMFWAGLFSIHLNDIHLWSSLSCLDSGLVRGNDEEICGLGFREKAILCCALCRHEAGHLPRPLPSSHQRSGFVNKRQTDQSNPSQFYLFTNFKGLKREKIHVLFFGTIGISMRASALFGHLHGWQECSDQRRREQPTANVQTAQAAVSCADASCVWCGSGMCTLTIV